MEKLLTVPEVADKLQVKASTVYAWVRQNTVQHIRVGRLIRFTTTQIEEFVRLSGHLASTDFEPQAGERQRPCL